MMLNPILEDTTIALSASYQSVSGKGISNSVSHDGTKAYLSGHSGVWISDDDGETFYHSELLQPILPNGIVSGGLLTAKVHDVLISPNDNNIVLATTGHDVPLSSKNGIYRSDDDAKSWNLVYPLIDSNKRSSDL